MTEAKKQILLVDDDVDFLTQMKTQLQAAGYDIVSAESRQEAEDILKDLRPDAAILDLMMEHSDAGFALAYHIKKKDAAIPVILVTAVTSETGLEFDATTAEERSWVKADAFLSKPIRFEQLLGTLERLIQRN